MTIKIYERYGPDRANAATAGYPDGSIKNESLPGNNDGTPLDNAWGNDILGGIAEFLDQAGISPSGNPDQVGSSDFFNAYTQLTRKRSNVYSINKFATVNDMVNNTLALDPVEGMVCRTNAYNAPRVICDWVWTQSPNTNDISISITANPGWSAVLVPLLGTILTPEMVGAYGDGIQEDHTYIQSCLDYFENNEFYGTVKPDRTYLIGDTIFGRSYSSICGIGLFNAKDGLDKTVIDIYAAANVRKIQNVEYSGFRIEGNKGNQTTTDDILGAGFSLRCDVENPFLPVDPEGTGETENITVKNITSNNCKVNNFYFGKNTFVTRGYVFTELKGIGAVNGIFLDNFCEYIEFQSCVMQNNQYGVLDNGSSNISFVGGHYTYNTEAGIYLETTGRNTSKKIITGIHFNHNKRGLWVGFGVGTVGVAIDQVVATNNHFLANTRQGVIGSGGNDCIIKNNVFSGNGGESSDTYDDIFLSGSCRRWDIDNKHVNTTGDTRHGVYYENGAATGADNHMYHKIDGTFEDFTNEPIAYLPSGDPTLQPLQANTNFVQGVFEYWNTAGTAPSDSAANANASIDLSKIPLGTICINNADNTGSEQWMAVKATSSSGADLSVSFKRIADYV